MVDFGGRGRRRGRAPRQPRGIRRLVEPEPTRIARYAWPAGVAGAGLAWYAADSLRHRREGGRGYMLHGAEVYEYAPTMLHAKSLVVDGVWSSVGSVNFDNRSFQQNDEATLCVRSEAFAGELTAQFERDLGEAVAIEEDRWRRRGPRRRAIESATKLARREL